jgi:hypothetical protein
MTGAGEPTWGLRALKAPVWAWGAELGGGAGARSALAAAPIEWWRLNWVWALEARWRVGSSEIGLGLGGRAMSRNWCWSEDQSPERKRATRRRMAWENDSGFSKGAKIKPS